MKYAPDSAVLGTVGHLRRRWDRWGRTRDYGWRDMLPHSVGGAVALAWITGCIVIAALIVG